jgi:hypothetical protein
MIYFGAVCVYCCCIPTKEDVFYFLYTSITVYLSVIKIYILFIFYDNEKNKSWYMCLIYNQSGFDSYANPLARS